MAVLAERFNAKPELDALPLVQDGRPCRMASRSKILTTLAPRFGDALYAKKPISVIADLQPLIASQEQSQGSVLDQAMMRADRVKFVRFFGIWSQIYRSRHHSHRGRSRRQL